jgi:hypothetical protein
MNTFLMVIVFAFVVTVLGGVAFAFFELTPFARRTNSFRDASGHRRWDSPHLD